MDATTLTSLLSWLPWLAFTALLVTAVAVALLMRSRGRLARSERLLVDARQALERRLGETRMLRDVNLRLSDEIERHQQSEALLNDILSSLPSALIGVARDGKVTHWNERSMQLSGIAVTDAPGRPAVEILPMLAPFMSDLEATIDNGEPYTAESLRWGEGSHTHHFDLTIFPLRHSQRGSGAVLRLDDISQRIQLESLMIQNEKMVALGELAAGMAHEINNPLSVVLQSVQSVQRRLLGKLPRNGEVAAAEGVELEAVQRYVKARKIGRLLNNMRSASERAADIVVNMLEFSRHNNRQRAWVDLVDLAKHSLTLAKPGMRLNHARFDRIRVISRFADEMPPVACCAAEIQQVLLNLLRNATQALDEALLAEPGRDAEPEITVTVGHDQHYARLTVADNGPGMNEEARRHIFDPFFTTKPVGKGTGLGLSISYFIIHEHHDGYIDVDSTPGQGTRFTIRLPLESHNAPVGV